MKRGDWCVCAGEGGEVFTVEAVEKNIVLLLNDRGAPHGWEPRVKVRPWSYALVLEREGPWFKLAYRYAVKLYPCISCSFALATHGMVDRAFGVGAPSLCVDCMKAEDDQEWKPVEPSVYDKDTQAVIKALGPQWLVARVP